MDLRLYNTRTRSIDKFESIEPGKVRMYCCGLTVYNFAHIGNLRTYVFEDLLTRSLRFLGYDVEHVMNVTDVGHLTDDGDDGEDKMIKAARERGQTVWDIAAFYTKAFLDDFGKLRINLPDVVCKATDHISEMIALIKRLEELGYTYQAGGNVYYDVSKFPHYGELALLDGQALLSGARIEVDHQKRNPRDFVLWFTNSKFANQSTTQAMLWDSPWGRGYPGWHIECSAMSHKYLGEHFDIHCGGVDHINVHHTNEIAQTEAATGRHPWVNYWMHAEFLILNSDKMSKSSGNFLTVSRLTELGYDPLDYRYFLLGAHYRTQLTYTNEAMSAAKTARARLNERIAAIAEQAGAEGLSMLSKAKNDSDARNVSENFRYKPDSFSARVAAADSRLGKDSRELLESFVADLSDDLNIPRSLARIREAMKIDDAVAAEKLIVLDIIDEVLGLDLLAEAERLRQSRSQTDDFSEAEKQDIQSLIFERSEARKAKNFARSDEIRDVLKTRGIVLVDTPQGTSFKRA